MMKTIWSRRNWCSDCLNGGDRTVIKSIPTTYGGVNFRSRLEARYAAFFDLTEWRWEYEPDIGIGGYIPDFVLLSNYSPIVVEVKPIDRASDPIAIDAMAKAEHALREAGKHNEILLLGYAWPKPDWGYSEIAIGWLGEHYNEISGCTKCKSQARPHPVGHYPSCLCEPERPTWGAIEIPSRWHFEVAPFRNGNGSLGFCHDTGDWNDRLSSSSGKGSSIDEDWVLKCWRDAGNIVQWHPGDKYAAFQAAKARRLAVAQQPF